MVYPIRQLQIVSADFFIKAAGAKIPAKTDFVKGGCSKGSFS